MIFAPALRARVSAAAHERRHAAGGHADDDVLLVEPQARDAPRAFLVVVLDAFLGLEDRLLAAGHDRLHDARRGAERRRHLGGFDDPEAAAGAGTDEDNPAALAQGVRDDLDPVRDPFLLFWTAAMTLRSSLTTMSMMSRTGVLSMARLTGLIASVGSDCHFD